MFGENDKKAYQSVKAPDELYDRILSSAEESKQEKPLFKTNLSRIVAAAACVVFVFGAVFFSFSNGGNVSVKLNGSAVKEGASVVVTNEAAPYALAREFSPAQIELTLDITKEALITVDSGSFDIVGEGENLTQFTADENVTVIWHSDGMKKSTMTVDYGRNTCELVLEYNGEWVITRK